jgi:hypothetical protein
MPTTFYCLTPKQVLWRETLFSLFLLLGAKGKFKV